MSEEENIEYLVSKRIETIYPPILLIVGLVGNTLSIIVLSKPKNRKTSTGVMFIILAVTDSLILVTAVLVIWLVKLFDSDFRTSSTTACKIHTFATYFLLQFSAWILVFVTIERVFSVRYPHRVRHVFTKRRVLVTMLIFVQFLAALNGHLLYGVDINEDNSRCQPKDELQFFMFNIWPWIDFMFAFAIPFCVMVSGNITIFIMLKSSQTFRKRSTGFSEEKKNGHSRISQKKQRGRTLYFTVTALVLNIAFVVFVSPFAIFAVGQPYLFPEDSITPKRKATLHLIGVVTKSLIYVNNAINFILYVISGSKFRSDFKELISCLRKRRRLSLRSVSSK